MNETIKNHEGSFDPPLLDPGTPSWDIREIANPAIMTKGID
jgi:hypothetical protein